MKILAAFDAQFNCLTFDHKIWATQNSISFHSYVAFPLTPLSFHLIFAGCRSQSKLNQIHVTKWLKMHFITHSYGSIRFGWIWFTSVAAVQFYAARYAVINLQKAFCNLRKTQLKWTLALFLRDKTQIRKSHSFPSDCQPTFPSLCSKLWPSHKMYIQI